MSAENAEIVRRSFSVQAENFGSDAMNFTNRDYLDDMVSRLDLAGRSRRSRWRPEPVPAPVPFRLLCGR